MTKGTHPAQTFLSDSDFCVCLEREQLSSRIVRSTNLTDSPVMLQVVCV